MSISRASEDLIIAQEVGSKAQYLAIYHRPEWPGGGSGVTIGIGYDLGMSTQAQIRADWGAHVSAQMLTVMAACAGITGQSAKKLLPQVRNKIDIPWDAAIAVFEKVSIPQWYARVRKALPNFELLPPDCKGVLVSLSYNRGLSYNSAGDRYREMRNIKQWMTTKQFDKIPAELDSMARLWVGTSVRGVATRRHVEARLFRQGLAQLKAVPLVPQETDPEPVEPDPIPLPRPRPEEADHVDDDEPTQEEIEAADPDRPTSEDVEVTKRGNELPKNSSIMIEVVKRKLDSFGYHEFGALNGEWGGRTVAAIAAYKTDRGLSGPAEIDDVLLADLDKASKEKWTRPMAEARANATAKDLAPKNEVIQATNQNKYVAWFLGIPAAIGGFFKGVFNNTGDAVSYLQPIKDFFGYASDIPIEYWLFGLVGVAVVLWLQANKAEKATVQNYRTGKLL